jgi:hypothetical protein
MVVKATSPPYCHCGRQISFTKKYLPPNLSLGKGVVGAHLRATVIDGWAPQRRPNLAFSLEARAWMRQWSGRSSIGIMGVGHQGPVAGRLGGRPAGEDSWAASVASEPVSLVVGWHSA